jgi:hypothetical protein
LSFVWQTQDIFMITFANLFFKINLLLMNLRQLVLLLLIPLAFTSCETDFELNAEWKDITIVYGILNQNDTAHYIRIQKAFLRRRQCNAHGIGT